MLKSKKAKPNYKAFAQDMVDLCKKYNICIWAYDDGMVGLGPAKAKAPIDFDFSSFRFSPDGAIVGEDETDMFKITVSKE